MQYQKIFFVITTILSFIFIVTIPNISIALQNNQIGFRLVGQIGGPTQGVAVQGNYAYVGVGLRLVVLDVSNPAELKEVGATSPFPYFVEDVVVSGTLAYVAAGGAGLRVVDISDPFHPTEVGAWDSLGYAEGVAVAGNIVYLADGPYGLRVVDVSNPTNPTEIGSAFPMNYAFKVVVQGQYAYIAAAGAGLLIADVSDPRHPVELSTFDTPGYAYGVTVSRNTAYVADGWEGLRIVNVADPAHPIEVGSYETPGWTFGIAVSGTLAYVADAFKGLRVLNVSNPSNPTEVGSYEASGGHAGSVAVAGSIAYIADRNWGLRAVDISNPSSLTQVDFYGPLGYADGIAVAGNYAYVAAGSYGLRIVDISDPARPRQVGAYDTQDHAKGVAVAGNYAYVGTDQGFQVVDVSDPSRPTRAGVLSDSFLTRDMIVAGGIVYIADEWGLWLVDVSNPTAPTKLSFLQTRTDAGSSATVGVAISGNVAYVAIERQGLLMVDVSNPSAPAVIGQFQWPNASAQDVVLGRGKAFVGDSGALTVLDVSNPRAPVWLASYPTNGLEESLALSGDQVFVANGGAGLSVINVSNPGSPTLAWSYRTPGYARSVFVRDDLTFVADSSGGLLILGQPGGGAAPPGGTATPPRVVVTQAMTQRVAPPPVRASAAPLPAARAVGAQAASSCVVSSTADSGAGTLRGCVEGATSGTTITFDPAVFPTNRPATIAPLRGMSLWQGNVTIDASNAGVILEGSFLLSIHENFSIMSDGNSIRGMQIVHFPGAGIMLQGNAHGNLIGGSRSRGSGPLGEGNLISGNGFSGIQIIGPNVTNTTITGNLIGTDITGTVTMGNGSIGIVVTDSSNNRIGGSSPGESNVISGNGPYGIAFNGANSHGNAITGNYIGLDASGTRDLSNGAIGIGLEIGTSGTLVQSNVIVSTNGTGIVIGDWSSYNTVVGNLLGTDASGRVALGSAQLGIGCGGAFNRIGGTTPVERNVIAQGGISAGRQGGSGNLVIGNFIGTDISGSIPLAQCCQGVRLADGSSRLFIGGTTAGERNIISGNPYGGIRVGLAADYTFIGGNYIGTDASGQVALANGAGGIVISQGTHIIVQGNLIAHHNGSAGITVSGYVGNTLRQNLIYDNQGGGIVLQGGGNNGASPPVITSFSATGVSGTACPGCEVEIFSDIEDEGQVYEGSTIANASGAFAFSKGSPLTGPNITATATDSNGNTSEFSAPMIISLFADVPFGYWAYNYIAAIYNAGITKGCSTNPLEYCPEDSVTRGQMAAFIIRAKYGENFNYTPTPYFSDVPATHTFFKYVQKLKDDGITAVSGSYGVDDEVTRGQMAAFIIRAKYGENFTYTQAPYFTDVPPTHGFFKYVQKLKDDGITTVSAIYGVDNIVTRAQMAAFLGRAFLGMQ